MNVGDDEVLLAEVVGLFLDDCPRLLATIDEAIRRADAVTLKRVAHTVRGVATTFALPAVIDAAKVLETKGQAGEWDGAIECSEELRRAFQRVRPALMELATVMS